MGSYVQNIKTESGDTIYPITSTKAVFDSEGKPIDEVVEEVKTTVNETISNIPGQLQKVQQTINTSLGNADISSIGDGTIKGAINALKENFKAGVDAIYNKIVAKGVTPASKTPSDCASAIDTACTNHYNSGVAATKKGTAGAGDVLAGKTFTNSSSVGATGTMTNRGAWTGSGTPSGNNSTKVTVPAGYHNGSGYVTCNGSTAYSKGVTDADNRANANSTNYKSGYNAGVKNGYHVIASNVSGSKSFTVPSGLSASNFLVVPAASAYQESGNWHIDNYTSHTFVRMTRTLSLNNTNLSTNFYLECQLAGSAGYIKCNASYSVYGIGY